MGANLMPRRGNLSGQGGMGLGDFPQHKKRRLHPGLGQEVEQGVRIRHHAIPDW
jgi:hypothetical protein